MNNSSATLFILRLGTVKVRMGAAHVAIIS